MKKLKTGLVYTCRNEKIEYLYYFFHNTGYYLSQKYINQLDCTLKQDLTEKEVIEALKVHAQQGGRDGFKALQTLRERFPGFENYNPV
jgi:hypothetical protein